MTNKIVVVLIVTCVVGACTLAPQSSMVATPPATAQNALATLVTRAQEGDDQAAVVLANAYYRLGNAAEAFKWLQVAANRGYAIGQAGLGHAYTFGLGVPQDYSLAFKYCHLAADQNDAIGLNNLAYLYERGLGVPVDLTAANGLYRRSAMQGNGFAQQALGFLYQEGHGVPIDYELAYFWDSLAASRLSGPAMLAVAKRRDDMAALLSSDVLTVLQTAATQWKPGTEPPAGRPVRPASAMAHSL